MNSPHAYSSIDKGHGSRKTCDWNECSESFVGRLEENVECDPYRMHSALRGLVCWAVPRRADDDADQHDVNDPQTYQDLATPMPETRQENANLYLFRSRLYGHTRHFDLIPFSTNYVPFAQAYRQEPLNDVANDEDRLVEAEMH
ncbi:unnamed protein product [Vitrella brassicaformis CCMP3155]|uniref:Uncharacterized protein n=1 Tax=Vitrella brassicaformis (strain CCMP3155) TaxID=1169540 RepID=A0A0G4FFI8_VITBC|nr:unnamed protein product [Vitrella brassicaformis CCMP3155]|eukprot:CEM11979.1 unnamed protein product [Vitrella brassicaformis CCMP3155]